MTLSICCVTNGNHYALTYLSYMRILADKLGCEFVVGMDKTESKAIKILADVAVKLPEHEVELQECVLDKAIEMCTGDYILRLDDDEKVSSALEHWILSRAYHLGELFAFPRVYMYPDTKHVLANDGVYPDLQTRLGKKEKMYGVNHIHAGNPHGTGLVIPYAIEHHNLIAKSYKERQKIADRYESIKPGCGRSNTYGRYLIPEDIYPELIIKDYYDGDYSK